MSLATPQLPTLIQARTSHLENFLTREGDIHQQVVILGVGLDTKPFRFARAGQNWFGVDLHSMIQERKKLFLELGIHTDYFIAVEGDIRTENWLSALSQAGYQHHLSTFFVLEGLSMYFTEPDLRRVLEQLRSLTYHHSSCVWLDHITETMFELNLPEVKAFLSSMTRLGEPFLSGFADANPIVLPYWQVITTISAANVLGILDPIHEEYKFTVLGIHDSES
jgi:methyltransferase (TIGR00027 family)